MSFMRGAVKRLEVSHLTRKEGDRSILDDVSFCLYDGGISVILGDSYSCKNALLRTLADRQAHRLGEVDFYDARGQEYSPVRSFCPAGEAVSGALTVREHFLLGCAMVGIGRSTASLRTDRLIDRFGLQNEKDIAVSRLDEEDRRLIAVLTALAPLPDMVFLEEPTTGLSDGAIVKLWDHIREIRGKTMIVLTSRYVQEAENLGGQILIAAGPGIVIGGSAQEILSATGKPDLMSAYMAAPARPAHKG